MDRTAPTAVIRLATTAVIERLRDIENDAGERFRAVQLDAIADDPAPPAAVLQAHIDAGTAWIAELEGEVVGYATASIVDGEGHLDQVSVIAAAAGRRIGRRLVDEVCAWAAARGLPSVTLTTFRDVAWNGPYYERLGFAIVPEDACGPELRAIRTRERAAGIEVAPRVAMRKSLVMA
jgi:GNAT superfamily N-acetyltransferase